MFSINNCKLIDGSERPPLDDVTLVVDGGVIQTVTTGSEALFETSGSQYDGRGLTVLPGLIDMHVHICHDPHHPLGSTMRNWRSPVSMTLNALQNLKVALEYGITTVRDLGGGMDVTLDVKEAWHQDRIRGARPYVSGHMITATGGHGTESGLEFGLEVDGATEVRKAVRRELTKGADLIKLVTCGASTPSELTLEELQAGVEEAHWCGYKVACHAHFKRRSIVNAIQAGCDTLEHGCLLDDEIVDLMLERGIYYCPTLTVIDRAIQEADNYGGASSSFYQTICRIVEQHKASFHLAYQRGVPIIGGTDAGMPGMSFSCLHEEMRQMVQLGMPPCSVIRSVTGLAADALGYPESLGYIRSGAIADLLVVADDPIADLSVLKTPKAVFFKGQLVQGELPCLGTEHRSNVAKGA